MSDVERVKERLQITDVISEYVELKKAGSNYKGLCPFHNEKSPSFIVNPSLQIFKCFGCGKGGDVLSFIQEIERASFPEALEMAAEKAGIKLENSYQKNPEEEQKKKRALQAHELATKLYHYLLTSHPSGKSARDYALKRGLNGEALEEFLVGFAPTSKHTLINFLVKKGFSKAELIEFGLAVERDGNVIDKFRNRLMQPVRDTRGEVVGFSGRYLGNFKGAPKYLNSPETVIFQKNKLLYGLFESIEGIRESKKILLMEGNLDVISSHMAGTPFAVAPLGTSLTKDQLKLAKRYADELYFAFDADTAGFNALIRSLEYAEEVGLRHKVIEMKDAKDPDELIQKDVGLWLAAVADPESTVQFIFQAYAKDLDLGNPDDKLTFKNKVLPIIRMLKDPVEIDHYTKEAAVLTEIRVDEMSSLVKNHKVKRKFEPEKEVEIKLPKEDDNDMGDVFLALMIQSSEKFSLPEGDVFTDDSRNKIYQLLKTNEEFNDSVLSTLDESTKELYKKLFLYNVSGFGMNKESVLALFKRLRRSYINNQILKLRKELELDSDNLEAITKLAKLSGELKSI